LSKRDVDRVSRSSLPRAGIGSPAHGLSDWDAEVTESKGDLRMENKSDGKKSENKELSANPSANYYTDAIPFCIQYEPSHLSPYHPNLPCTGEKYRGLGLTEIKARGNRLETYESYRNCLSKNDLGVNILLSLANPIVLKEIFPYIPFDPTV
jgi:hypothetical protein